MAPAATRAGTLSAAGEALQRLPAMVARPWICVEPIRFAASTTPGQAFFKRGILAELGAGHGGADLEAVAVLAGCPRMPGMRLISTIRSGSMKPVRRCTSRSVPPAST